MLAAVALGLLPGLWALSTQLAAQHVEQRRVSAMERSWQAAQITASPAVAVDSEGSLSARGETVALHPATDEAQPSGSTVRLAVDAASGGEVEFAAELANVVRKESGLDLMVQPDDDRDLPAALRPDFAIVLYELLAERAAAQPSQVVAALFNEEVHVIVRRDAPWRFVHEIENARIGMGPSHSQRQRAALLFYERLFAHAPAPGQAVTGDLDDALRRLVQERSIDVLLLVAAQPSAWLAGLAPSSAREIRLLAADPTHPSSQRAYEGYLPAVIRADRLAGVADQDTPTFATMAFLVVPRAVDDAAAQRISAFTEWWCRSLSQLRRLGHPKWREVQTSLRLDVGQPYLAPAKVLFPDCAVEPAVTAANLQTRSRTP